MTVHSSADAGASDTGIVGIALKNTGFQVPVSGRAALSGRGKNTTARVATELRNWQTTHARHPLTCDPFWGHRPIVFKEADSSATGVVIGTCPDCCNAEPVTPGSAWWSLALVVPDLACWMCAPFNTSGVPVMTGTP